VDFNDILKTDKFLVLKDIPSGYLNSGVSYIRKGNTLTIGNGSNVGSWYFLLNGDSVCGSSSYNGTKLLKEGYLGLSNRILEDYKHQNIINLEEIIESGLYCNCNSPKLIKNNAAGEVFNYCTICKKENSKKYELSSDGKLANVLIRITTGLYECKK
jgi:hypothetical protein